MIYLRAPGYCAKNRSNQSNTGFDFPDNALVFISKDFCASIEEMEIGVIR